VLLQEYKGPDNLDAHSVAKHITIYPFYYFPVRFFGPLRLPDVFDLGGFLSKQKANPVKKQRQT
jgi:hypothetical protein